MMNNIALQKTEITFLDTVLVVNEDFSIVKIVESNVEHSNTFDLVGCRIDQIPGLLYTDIQKDHIFRAISECMQNGVDRYSEFAIARDNGQLLRLKVRLVSIPKYVIITLHDQKQLLKLQKENNKLASCFSKQKNLIELALQKSDMAVYSFNFERFNACDRVHCQRCFQFCGTTNELLERNKYLCRALTVLRHPDDRDDFFRLFNTLRNENREELKLSFRLKNNEGVYRLYEVYGKVQEYDVDEKVNLIIGTVTDNHEQVEYERSLIEAKEKAETADRLKSAFLANMTHEIRTPLHAIVGFSDLLKMETDPEIQEEYIDVIKSNNEMLMRLVNDVLDISKIEANMITFSYIPLNVPIWMNDVYKAMRMHVSEEIEFIMDSTLNVNIETDKQRLTQIMTNLLTNAIKYTEKGSIRMGYTVDETHIHFYVSDTGVGIAKDKLKHVFSRFEQLKKGKKGVGLGLAISNGLVSRMGGEINVTSEEGVGSTFSFSLPLKPIL